MLAWFLMLAMVTVLIRVVAERDDRWNSSGYEGVPAFGGLMLLLLGLSLIAVPALMRGACEQGVLAGSQDRPHTATETALGTLLAVWGTALVFVLVALPLVVATMVMGGVSIGTAGVCLAIVAVLLLSASALAQAVTRAGTRTSAVLCYLVVFGLAGGTLLVYLAARPLTNEPARYTNTQPVYDDRGRQVRITTDTFTINQSHPEKIWWLLAPNPFAVLADATPVTPTRRVLKDDLSWEPLDPLDPLGVLGDKVRRTRNPHWDPTAEDYALPDHFFGPIVERAGEHLKPGDLIYRRSYRSAAPVWPWGLACHGVLTVGAAAVTIRRLRGSRGADCLPAGVKNGFEG